VFPDYALSAEHQLAIARERRAAVVGELLMKKYGWKLGQQITLRATTPVAMDLSFVIMGTIQSKHYPNTFIFNRSYLMEAFKAHGMGDVDYAWQLIVRADNSDHLAMLAKEIDERFANSDAETRSETSSRRSGIRSSSRAIRCLYCVTPRAGSVSPGQWPTTSGVTTRPARSGCGLSQNAAQCSMENRSCA